VPRREDYGDLTVVYLRGSYTEMGRQQAELLGDDLRRVYDFQRAEYRRALERGGVLARVAERLVIPIASGLGRFGDESGWFAEAGGVADGLGRPRREVLRAQYGLVAASTVFAATRSATADGGPLLGRNADWDDAGGLRRPLISHYAPTNGDLRFLSVRWPLNPLPVIGLNEAGFALSFNFFETEPLVTLVRPSWPHRRALQRARTVEEGIRIFRESDRLGISCFMVMMDAAGDLAMLECRPASGCAVFRPDGDWFAQANHARTSEMQPHDLYRHPDSYTRLADMEAAVSRRLGQLTPVVAAEILRDRAGHRYANANSVGNLFVLNAAVVQPAKGLLWHSTSLQPYAPFGAYHVFTATGEPAAGVPDLPADPGFASGALAPEAQAVATARRAIAFQQTGKPAAARALWDALADQEPALLDPARLALGRATTLYAMGETDAAFDALAPAVAPEAPYEVRVQGLVQRGLLLDALGRRGDAAALYGEAIALIDAHPDYSAFATLRARAQAGLENRQSAQELPIDWWSVGVPR
jgi:tetratricopeptide (TPR) repeat protein